jgi:phosphatidylinositol alpha-1,6-mannosyltransferase
MRTVPLEIVHVLTGANSLIGLLFLLYGKLNNLKTGIFLYGKEILSSKNKPLRFLTLHLSIILAGKVGVNSHATAGLLPKHALHKLHLLYPGVDIQSLTKHKVVQERNGEEKNVLFVGRLIRRKGVDDLLRSFALLLETMPHTMLSIVGDGPQRKNLDNLAKKLGIQHKTKFTGKLTEQDLHRKYQECDVFVMPSKNLGDDVEGFGMVFLEASFFKKPSIGTRSGGIPEAIIHQETGILVPEGDVTALKDALETLLANSELTETLGRNAHKRVINEFSWKKATTRLTAMYS